MTADRKDDVLLAVDRDVDPIALPLIIDSPCFPYGLGVDFDTTTAREVVDQTDFHKIPLGLTEPKDGLSVHSGSHMRTGWY